MKALLFDAGPIISLTTNNLLWLLEPLKEKFGGEFFVTEGVRRELVDRPLQTKKFKFEALQVQHKIERKVLSLIDDNKVRKKAMQLLDLANGIFYVNNKHYLKVLQLGEIESLAAARLMNIPFIVVDERITRLLLENPGEMEQLLEKRLHRDVHVDRGRLAKLHKEVEGVKLIRSAELVAMAYELGILDEFITSVPQARKELLEAVLWGVKLNGCSMGQEEIDDIVGIELKKNSSEKIRKQKF